MGIPERKNRERNLRKQQIQNAAKELFINKGFHSTTMEEIAQRAELSPGTLYLYFQNKEELYASINLITLQGLFNEIEKIYSNKNLSVEKKIIKLKDGMYKVFKNDPLILRNILHVQLEDTLPALSKELLDELNKISQKSMAMIANVYEEGVRQGKFREGDGMAHADIIWSTFTGLVIWEESKRKINPKKDFLKSTLDRAFDIICQGIKK
ncbi:MAG: TetR/AcrR family transcriptional regulator [Deltaproteobacteria bacterium]|nr:TetR/AcrR family transcriptional regulator [Deltaproteobacteria bacterium]